MAKASSSWVSSSFDCFMDPANSGKSTLEKQRKRKASRSHHGMVATQWVHKYSPTHKDELAVHGRKVEQVDDWLKQALILLARKKGSCPMLLLTGPSGCGKTATVRVLASDLALSLQEWKNSSQYVAYKGHQTDQEIVYEEGQISNLSSFLLRASRYRDLCQEGCRLLLLEELPNACFREPNSFHSLLRRHSSLGKCLTVFIMSDCSQRERSTSILFPKDLLQELAIHEICFNPITTLTINKLFLKILSAEKEVGERQLHCLSKGDLHCLAENSRGDVRSALNSLQFAATRVVKKCKSLESETRRASQVKDAAGFLDGGKDSALVLFHALGKILYCKRDESKQEPQLPAHLSRFQRSPLIENPEGIAERAVMSSQSLNLFLHQNFLEFFGEPDVVCEASDCLSTADCLHPGFEDESGENEYGSSVGVRGLMFHLGKKKQQDASKHNRCGKKWRPLGKPVWYDTNRICQKHLSSSREEFKESLMSLGQDLYVTAIPFMSKIFLPSPAGRINLIQKLSRFTNGNEIRQKFCEVLQVEDENQSFLLPVCSLLKNSPECSSLFENEDNVQIEDISD